MAANINAFEVFAKVGFDGSALKKGLETAKGTVSKFGGAAKSAFSTLGSFATNIFKGLTSKIKSFFADARAKSAEFEQSMAQVAATMGKTVQEMDSDVQTVQRKVIKNGEAEMEEFTGNLRQYAMKLGAETKFTSAQVGEAMNYMALAGYNTVTTMKMLPDVLNLAAAGGMELARASDMVTDIATSFGLRVSESEKDAERVTQMIDEMAKAASTGNTSVTQLGDAMLVIGGLAQEVGNGTVRMADGTKAQTDNIQELEIALTAMANAGVKGSEAGMHMRNMLLKLAAPTDKAKETFEEIGVDIFDNERKMKSLHQIFLELSNAMIGKGADERLQIMGDLFNTRDIVAMKSLLSAVETTDWNYIGESIMNAEGAAEKMKNTLLNTVQGSRELWNSAMDNFKITVADSMTFGGGKIAQLFRFGADAISTLTDALRTGGWEGFTNELWNQFEIIFAKVMDEIPNMVTGVITKIPKYISATLPTLMKSLTKILTTITEAISGGGGENGRKIRAAVKNTIFLIKQAIKQNGPELLAAAKEFLTTGLNKLASFASTLFGGTGGLLQKIFSFFSKDKNDSDMSPVKEAGSNLFDVLVSGLAEAAGFIGENIVPVVTGIASALMESDVLSNLNDAAWKIIDKLIDGLLSQESLDKWIEKAPEIINGLADGILTFLGGKEHDGTGGLFGAASKIVAKIGTYLADEKNREKIRNAGRQILLTLGKVLVDSAKILLPFISQLAAVVAGAIVEDTADFLKVLFHPNEWGDDVKYGATRAEKEAWLASGTDEELGEWMAHNYEDQLKANARAMGLEDDTWRNYDEQAMNIASFVSSTGVKGVPVFGNGGIVTEPTLALVGEDGAEAIIPLEHEGSVKARLKGTNGTNVTIEFGNIYVQGGQNTGQEVVKQIDTALRQYQVQQERGTGGTAWLKSIRYQTERAH